MLEVWLEKSLQRTEDRLLRKAQKTASRELAQEVLLSKARPKVQLKERFNKLYQSFL